MKKLSMTLLSLGVLLALLAGCHSTKMNPIDEEKALLRSNKDIVISGKTGGIKGSSTDKAPQGVVCKDCGFPEESLRQRVIISGEVDMDDKMLRKLKEKRNVILSGKTGAFKSTTKDRKSNPVKCPGCGFPKGSLRKRVIISDEL